MFSLSTDHHHLFSPCCFLHSRRWCSSPDGQTTRSTNARRVSPAQQDSLLAKSTRICYQGPAHVVILTVRVLVVFLPHPFFPLARRTLNCSVISLVDIPTYTKSVSSRQRRISRSWSLWTREVRAWRRMRCIITSWMGRIRLRSVSIFTVHWALFASCSFVFSFFVLVDDGPC